MLRLLTTLLAIAVAPAAMAADITVGQPNRDSFDIQMVDPALPCSHRLTGQIRQGDADRIIRTLRQSIETWRSQNIYGQSVLCLDSAGGSLVEALKVADVLRSDFIGTKIESGATCESACALMFMAGSFYAHESGAFKWRVLHPRGRLGFHAPSLQLGAGSYDSKVVAKSYGLALETIAMTLTNLVQNRDYDDGEHMQPSLLAAMLRTPPDSMLYIETVDQAGRWDINVGPLRTAGLMANEHDFKQACANQVAWGKDESSLGVDYGDQWTTWSEDQYTGNVSVLYNEMQELSCDWSIPRGLSHEKRAPFDQIQSGFVELVDFAPPQYLLADLPH